MDISCDHCYHCHHYTEIDTTHNWTITTHKSQNPHFVSTLGGPWIFYEKKFDGKRKQQVLSFLAHQFAEVLLLTSK